MKKGWRWIHGCITQTVICTNVIWNIILIFNTVRHVAEHVQTGGFRPEWHFDDTIQWHISLPSLHDDHVILQGWTKNIFLEYLEYFYWDDHGEHDATSNFGIFWKNLRSGNSASIEVIGWVHVDVCMQERLIPNNVTEINIAPQWCGFLPLGTIHQW